MKKRRIHDAPMKKCSNGCSERCPNSYPNSYPNSFHPTADPRQMSIIPSFLIYFPIHFPIPTYFLALWLEISSVFGLRLISPFSSNLKITRLVVCWTDGRGRDGRKIGRKGGQTDIWMKSWTDGNHKIKDGHGWHVWQRWTDI